MIVERFGYADQKLLFDRNECPAIHIVGTGGATNGVIVCLATMGVREIHTYDPDVLEGHNGPGEPFYSDKDIGKPKVEAAVNTISYLRSNDPGVKVMPHKTYVDENFTFSGIVIAGPDSMKSRRKIWAAVNNTESLVPLFIDIRSAGKSMTILIVDPLDEEDVCRYENTWMYSDEDAVQEECGARNIPYISFQAAATVGHIIACYTKGTLRKDFYQNDDGIDIPFYFDGKNPLEIEE